MMNKYSIGFTVILLFRFCNVIGMHYSSFFLQAIDNTMYPIYRLTVIIIIHKNPIISIIVLYIIFICQILA